MKLAITLLDVCFCIDWKSSGFPSGVEDDSVGKITDLSRQNRREAIKTGIVEVPEVLQVWRGRWAVELQQKKFR